MTTEEILPRLEGVKRTGAGWQARCPAHEDGTASLSVKEGDDRRTLLHCHAGCDTTAVVGALKLTMRDLMPEKARKGTGRGQIVATYDYTDEAGALLFQAVRYEPKTFKARHRDPAGKDGWTWNVKGVRRVVFRLPRVQVAIAEGKTVYVVEGEKDALALESKGLVATCNVFGALKWQASDSDSLKGATVVIVADKDETGREHAQKVAASLNGKAASVRIIEVPDVDGKPCKDAADFIAAGGDVSALVVKDQNDTQPNTAAPPAKLPEGWTRFFYHGRGYTLATGSHYIPLDTGAVRDHLATTGTKSAEIAAALCKIRVENFVTYSGPMPGWKAGIYDDQHGGKILVTSSPKIIQGSAGPHPTIARIFRGLFSDPEHPDQQLAVLSWLKIARQNVADGQRRPLPALAMVGPRNCGKTLALEIFRLAFGGRSVPAYRALTSETGFNSALLDAELLCVDDEVVSRDHRARTRFAQAIKSTLFGGAVQVERKHQDAFTARPVHALAIAVNDEPEHIQILPILDDSLADKLSLIHVGRADLHADETHDREKLMETIVGEMPAFVAWLEAFEIPDHLRDTRTKALAWQHKAIVDLLVEISPESQLRELLSQCDAISLGDSWRGGASKAEAALLDDPKTKHSARNLLSWPAACGVFLGRLADSGRGVSRAGRNNAGLQQWEITE